MMICYQYESAYFPVPYVDNQLLCSLCGPKRSHAFSLRASNTTTRFSSRLSNFYNFTPRLHQKRSQKVRNPKFSWGGMPPGPPSRRAMCSLIAYWNPPFQNLRSAAVCTIHPYSAVMGMWLITLSEMLGDLCSIQYYTHCYKNIVIVLHLLCITSSDWNLLMGTVSMIDVVLLFPTSFDAVILNSNRLQLASSGS